MTAISKLIDPSVMNPASGDYFRTENGVTYAGMHILIDLWDCKNLDRPDFIEGALRKAAADAGANVLHGYCHYFSPYGGVSGVLVLAESHISIHTWPERGYAAIDIFMCGSCDPRDAVPALKRAFAAKSVTIGTERRGIVEQG